MKYTKGIDISHYQTITDWDKLAQAVDFVILKATQGHALSSSSYNFTDSKFHEYIKELIKRGVPVGAYHFFTGRTTSEAIAEADYFCSVIAPYKDKLIYAVCDAENYGNKYLLGLTKAQLSANITAFCDRVKSNGYKAAHYTNTDHVQSYINAGSIPYPMWRAHYQSNANAEKAPFSLENVIAWQYSSSGSVEGIKNATDLNYGYFELSEPDYATLVCVKCGLEQQTKAYLNAYKYASDLWRKLYGQMK